MMRPAIVLLSLSVFIPSSNCAKILAIYQLPAYSHFTLGFRLARELADRGHQVTVINPYPQTIPIKNYRDISVADNVEFIEEFKKQLFAMDKKGAIDYIMYLVKWGSELTERTFKNENVQKLLNSGETFDVVIMEHFLNDAHVGIGHHFKAPIILTRPSGTSALNNHLFANPAPSSYIPNSFTALNKHMTFFERLQNYCLNILVDIMRETLLIPNQRSIFKKYVKTDLELDDVLYNVSLMLTNSHVSVNDAVPHVPGVIEIGGFHVQPPKELPDDVQRFLDGATEGVVLFSMGTNLKSKDLKPEVLDSILKAFSKIKQKVLWKFEEELPEAPKNHKIMKWLPQQDILAHPNVRAFISHGGLLSTIETVYHGVPLIGIPVFGDQKSNIAAAVSGSCQCSFRYRENVQQRSRVMNDQPLKPIDSAVYWVEHVIRHRGAPHLRSAGLHLKWYQREMVDIIVFLTLVTIAIFLIFYVSIKKIVGLCSKRNIGLTEDKKNK